MKRAEPLEPLEPLRLVAVEPARTVTARGVVPSSREGRCYERVRAARIEVFGRVRESGTRVGWLVRATPIGDNDAAWPEYAEQVIGDDLERLIELAMSDAVCVFAVGVLAPDDGDPDDGDPDDLLDLLYDLEDA